MRIPLVAGNWKMNKSLAEARELVLGLKSRLSEITGVDQVLCPPHTALQTVSELLKGTNIGVGAQNMHWEDKGAFTGEVSPIMVRELCAYVILGHSERRMYFGETDDVVNRKLLAAQKHDLTPIVCVGETLEEYESNRTREVVTRQIRRGLESIPIEFAPRVIVAYEPVWAIGTGKASSSDNANSVVKDFIRPALAELFDEPTAGRIRVLYGGSVTSSNAGEYFGKPEIDGALVGGASLKVDEFVAIMMAAGK